MPWDLGQSKEELQQTASQSLCCYPITSGQYHSALTPSIHRQNVVHMTKAPLTPTAQASTSQGMTMGITRGPCNLMAIAWPHEVQVPGSH